MIGVFGGSLPFAAALFVRISADRKATVRCFLYMSVLQPVSSHGLRGSVRRDAGVLLLSAAILFICIPGDRGRAIDAFFAFALPPFHF